MWLEVWAEMTQYFASRAELQRMDRSGGFVYSEAKRTYIFKQSGRARFCKKYTVACNTPFQGIAADGAKEAVIRVFEACYFEYENALFGCKPILFVHDEIVLECPLLGEDATFASYELRNIMEECMEKYTPDIPAQVEAALSRVWTKDAKSFEKEDGTYSIYSPCSEKKEEEEEEAVPRLDSPKKDIFIARLHKLYETYYK
jgi:DNA polymerase I-like protein with 3'-5' exonuclease and polymerase domains